MILIRPGLVALPAIFASTLALSTPAAAQTQPTPPAEQPARSQPAQGQPKATSKSAATPRAPAATQPKEDPSLAGSRAADPALRQRIEQLEEQLADMQVLVGTLESLGKGGGSAMSASASEAFRSPPGGGGGVDQARLDSLETQMRAISDQLEQLTAQVSQLSGRRGELAPSSAPLPPPSTPDPAPSRPLAAAEPPRSGGFGSVTVTPGAERDKDQWARDQQEREPRDRERGEGERDPIGRLITGAPTVPASPAASQPLPAPVTNAGNPKELYETAYGYLLQQDYPAAEVAFEEFLRRHPNDRLAADAQYWLGEALYVQRRYKPAGQAFLRVIQKHQTSSKVPNSILKLALTIDQLGQKDCSLFDELETRHPNASADVKAKARALKQRVGC